MGLKPAQNLVLGMTAAVLLAGCSGSEPIGLPGGLAQDAITVQPGTPAADGFALCVSEASLTGGGDAARFSHAVKYTANAVTVEVIVHGARELKALLFDLEYDSAHCRPVKAGRTGLLGAGAQMLSLCVLDDPGVVHCGFVMTRPQDRPGFSGDGVLAQIDFANEPAQHRKDTAAAVHDPRSAVRLLPGGDQHTLSWYYTNIGDYDQSGVVDAADLIPLAEHLGAAGDPYFGRAGVEHMIDGDRNGQLNMADVTPVGLNYGAHADGGYYIFSSESTDDLPQDPIWPNGKGAVLIGKVPFDNATGAPDGRLHFTFTSDVPLTAPVYWARPVGKTGPLGTAGLPSGSTVVHPPLSVAAHETELLRLDWDDQTGLLRWSYVNPGDCDQDGLVTWLTEGIPHENSWDADAIFHAFGTPGPYDLDSRLSILDANGDGVIESDDWSVVAANENQGVAGYNIYASDFLLDYPPSAEAPSVIEPLGFIGLKDALGDPAIDRLHFEYALPSPQTGVFYWARPVVFGTEGLASEYAGEPRFRVPTDVPAAPRAQLNEAGDTLSWHYFNPGDFDQDGHITIADIDDPGFVGATGMIGGPFADSALLGVYDAYEDGRIDAFDREVAARRLGLSVSGFNVYGSADPADRPWTGGDASTVAPLAYVPFESATGDPAAERLHFSLDVTPAPDMYYWVRAVYEEQEGSASLWAPMPEGNPVQNPLGATFPALDAGTGVLSWGYYNPGDYDQNGQVLIGDLELLAVHLGENVPDDPDSLQAVLDGNNSGAVDFTDLQVVATYLNSQVAGYRVYCAPDTRYFPESHTDQTRIDPIREVMISEATGDPAAERLRFSVVIDDVRPGWYCWVRPFDELGIEGTPSWLIGGR